MNLQHLNTPAPKLDAPKSEWRRWAKGLRAMQPDHSAAITAHTAALLRKLGAKTVLLYHALDGEPDLSGLGGEFELLTTRARVRPTRKLTLHAWETATERSPIGVMQPPANTPEVAPAAVDAVVVPAIAYDRAGFRLGYGGGFYDRFLAELRSKGLVIPTIGVTVSTLLLGTVPREAHDIPLNWLVTEQGAQRAAQES